MTSTIASTRIHRHGRNERIDDPAYLGLHRTHDRVVIHIVAGNPGLRPEDVLIVLSPNAREAGCFDDGRASCVTDEAA